MKIIFLGPPGAGKGTLAIRLANDKNLPHISTGELFRTASDIENALGKRVKTLIDAGSLVPDEITIEMVKNRLSEQDVKTGYILDGFPRTTFQADALARFSSVDTVVNLILADSEIIRRLTGRRLCRDCNTGFHVEFMPPKQPGICDVCGGELYTRNDDSVESIKTRLIVYQQQTQPLIEYYTEKNLLINVDATPLPEGVYSNLKAALSEG